MPECFLPSTEDSCGPMHRKPAGICTALSEGTTHPLDAQPQQRKEVGQIYKALGFPPLGINQGMTPILLVEQCVEPLLHSLWQPKPSQIIGYVDFDLNCRRHMLGLRARSFALLKTSTFSTGRGLAGPSLPTDQDPIIYFPCGGPASLSVPGRFNLLQD
jgi:hypothetical protein